MARLNLHVDPRAELERELATPDDSLEGRRREPARTVGPRLRGAIPCFAP